MGLYDTGKNHENYFTEPFTSLHLRLLDQSSSLCETIKEGIHSLEQTSWAWNSALSYYIDPLLAQ